MNGPTIVCGVDFSAGATQAMRCAMAWAAADGGRVHVTHGYVIPSPPVIESGLVWFDERRVTEAIETELAMLVDRHRPRGVSVSVRAVPGWPAHVLLLEAGRVGADLLCVGTRGLSGLPRWLLGSVAERVTRISPIPVLVVPDTHSEQPGVVRRIVCAVDYSEPSEHALELALSLASRRRAELHVLHAYEGAHQPAGADPHAALAEGEHERELLRRTTRVIERCGQAPARLHVRVRREPPDAAIVAEAESVHADLVVLGSTGRSRLAELLLGRVAERVLRVSPMPVLVVRPQRAARS